MIKIKQGLVVKSTGSWYSVIDSGGNYFKCRIRGKFRMKDIRTTNPVAVGDKVDFEIDTTEAEGIIIHIQPRKNYIIRKSIKLSKQAQIIATNIDMAYLVVTAAFPRTSTGFIDRFLATAEAYSIPATLVFNKADLFEHETKDLMDEILEIYLPLGYRCLVVSALSGKGLSDLKNAVNGRISLFSGHSGVGKSTLLNALYPELSIKTGSLSVQHLTGTHTTTFAEMHPLPENTFLIDTPGIREFGTLEMEPWEISHYFKEMIAVLNGCQFNNCLHINEPGCKVLEAVNQGVIHQSRYYNYVGMVNNEDSFR
jgi:ribosome biogenesis GTPase / thiamine phosphate phosphatase